MTKGSLTFFERFHLSRAIARGGKVRDAQDDLSFNSHFALMRLVERRFVVLDAGTGALRITAEGREAFTADTQSAPEKLDGS